MIKEETLYGLMLKGTDELLGYDMSSNAGSDFCGEYTYELHKYGDKGEWLVSSYEQAKYVKYNSTEWYNADHATPVNRYDSKDLVIVKVKRTIEIEEMEELPNKVVKFDKEKCKEKYPEGWCYAFDSDKPNRRKSNELNLAMLYGNEFVVEEANNRLYKVVKGLGRPYSPIYIKQDDCVEVNEDEK